MLIILNYTVYNGIYYTWD